MILQLLNALLMAAILTSGWLIYGLEHQIRAGERRIAELNQQIAEEQDYTRLLGAEWANLSNPQRIKKLAAEHLPDLSPLKPQQMITESELESRLPPRAAPLPKTPNANSSDPIGDILKDLQ